MKNFTSIKTSVKSLLLVLFLSLLSFQVFAEEISQASPRAKGISESDIISESYFNDSEDNQLKFYIANKANENLYFVFDPTDDGEYFISIYRSSTSKVALPITYNVAHVFLKLFELVNADDSEVVNTELNTITKPVVVLSCRTTSINYYKNLN